MKNLNLISLALVVVGSLNWGLVGLLDLNLVNILFSSVQELERVLYILIGISGIFVLLDSQKRTKK